MRNGRGRPRGRIGTKAVALVATFALFISMCPGVAGLAFANGRLADGSAGLEAQSGGEALSAQAGGETKVDSNTHTMKTGTYRVTGNVTIEPDGSGSGIRVEKGAKVLLVIDAGKTLTVTGGYRGAAILLPEGSTGCWRAFPQTGARSERKSGPPCKKRVQFTTSPHFE